MNVEMTKNMQRLFQDIIGSLGLLPKDRKRILFGDDEEEQIVPVVIVAQYIALEYIKYAFDFSDPEYPLRHFLPDADDDCERMLQSRIVQYSLKYKRKNYLKENRSKKIKDGQPIYGMWKGVRVGVIRTHGIIGTIFPDSNQPYQKRRKK